MIFFFFFSPGQRKVAQLYLSKFKWGKTFLSINGELLDKYCACGNSADVVDVQNKYLQELEEESRRVKGKCIMYLLDQERL